MLIGGCGDNQIITHTDGQTDGQVDGAARVDAMPSADATIDASVADAANADASPSVDAAIAIDATPVGTVSMHVAIGGQPTVGRAVIYQAADGTLLGTETTDDDGKASQQVAAGAMVSEVPSFPVANGDLVLTIEGAKPGDALHVITPPTPTNKSIGVRFALLSGAVDYQVWVSCDGNATPYHSSGTNPAPGGGISVDVSACGASADLLMIGIDGNGAVVKSLYAPLVSTSMDYIDDGQHGEFVAPRTMALQLDDVPASVMSTDVTFSLISNGGALWQPAHDPPLDPNSFSGTVLVPDVAGITWAIQINYTQGGNTPVLQQTGERIEPADSYELDVGALLYPWPSNFAVDATTQRVNWDEEPGTTEADFSYSLLFVQRADDSTFQWIAVAPYQDGGMALPILPAGFDQPNLVTTDTVQFITIYGRIPGGYNLIEQHDTTFINGPAVNSLPIGQPGIVAVYYPF